MSYQDLEQIAQMEKDKDYVRNNVARLARLQDVAGTLANLERYVPNSTAVGSGSASFNRGTAGFMGGIYVGYLCTHHLSCTHLRRRMRQPT